MDKQIEAILFYKNGPVSIKELSKLLEKDEGEIKTGIQNLKEKLEDRGLSLVENGELLSLVTSKENSELIEKITKDELSKDIGKAGLETLSIILYKGEVSRREIDYIRGVNSNFILRNLLTRGLIERIENEKDGRTYLYKATLELLALLGVKSTEDLPQFKEITDEIKTVEESKEPDEQN
jgi:segregation and condensation protein B